MARERTRLGSCAGQRARQEAGRVTDLRGRRALRRLGGKHEWRQHQQGAEAAAGGTRTCKRPRERRMEPGAEAGEKEGRRPAGKRRQPWPRWLPRKHLGSRLASISFTCAQTRGGSAGALGTPRKLLPARAAQPLARPAARRGRREPPQLPGRP